MARDRGHGDHVDVLEDEWADAAGDDLRHRRHHVVEHAERRHHRAVVLGAGIELERGLGDERERALGADDQLRQVVAGRRLDEPAPGADHVAVGQRGFEAEHLMAGHAVLHRAHAARVGGDVAAEAGAVLARVHRVDEPVRSRDLVELAQGDTRLHDGDVVLLVDLEDAVHPLERDDDRVGRRHDRTRKAGAVAARGDGRPVVVGHPQDAGDFGSRSANSLKNGCAKRSDTPGTFVSCSAA